MTQITNFQNLVYDAVRVVEFKLIRSPEDVDDDSIAFPPEMAHQIFGETENIFGYKDLRIRIMYNAGPMQIYIGIKYTNRVDDVPSLGMKADNLEEMIATNLPEGCYYTNIDDFLGTLKKSESFKPFGDKVGEHKVEIESGKERHFEFYKVEVTERAFSSFFERLQTFVLWFVDAASYIDVEDPQWTYYICYEKYKNADGNFQYATVGYSTVYLYYAYPEHIRPRISQMLILPPFQKLGICSKLIETIYAQFRGNDKVIDITVEGPSDIFQHIRNIIDSKLCQDLPAFQPDVIKKGFNQEMIKQAREKHKINPRQCRKVYEILRFLHTNVHNPDDYRNYRLEIKKRLDLLHYKQVRDIQKLTKAGIDPEFMIATLPSHEERIEQLSTNYKAIEQEYEKIIQRLK